VTLVADAVPEQASANGAGGFANFRLIPRIETYPSVVSFAKTDPGKFVVLALFGLGLACTGKDWWPLSLWLILTTFLPERRRMVTTAGTLSFAFLAQPSIRTSILIVLILVLAGLLFQCANWWPRSRYGRRPLLFLLSGFSILIVLTSRISAAAPYYRALWDFTLLFAAYVWFIGYSLLDRNAANRDSFGLQLGTYRAFWGSTNTPFVKGAAYLRKIEARDAEQLAVTQLKGLKLLAWIILLTWLGRLFDYGIFDRLGVPPFDKAMFLSASGNPLPWYTCWASLVAGFFGGLISLSIWGNRFVACCRMAGFNALRNTYRPLSSRTVAEFFNRYYFYFKELLVEFFFYPTFLRCFKGYRKLRLIAATFAAACFGNAFFHFTRDLFFVQKLGLRGAIGNFQVFLFYCVALATAISISNLRHRGPRPNGFIRGQLLPSASVVLFYCLLDVFGSTQRNYPLVEHFRFFAHLFNLNV
jgi:hypothetical protein